MTDYIECPECEQTYHRKCEHDCPGPALRRWEVERMIEEAIRDERRRTERMLRMAEQGFAGEAKVMIRWIADAFAVEEEDVQDGG